MIFSRRGAASTGQVVGLYLNCGPTTCKRRLVVSCTRAANVKRHVQTVILSTVWSTAVPSDTLIMYVKLRPRAASPIHVYMEKVLHPGCLPACCVHFLRHSSVAAAASSSSAMIHRMIDVNIHVRPLDIYMRGSTQALRWPRGSGSGPLPQPGRSTRFVQLPGIRRSTCCQAGQCTDRSHFDSTAAVSGGGVRRYTSWPRSIEGHARSWNLR
jgi:hypothetical protein